MTVTCNFNTSTYIFSHFISDHTNLSNPVFVCHAVSTDEVKSRSVSVELVIAYLMELLHHYHHQPQDK